MLRRFLGWLADQSHIAANAAKQVNELRRVQLAPKGLDRSQVRRLLREIELRQDMRAGAIFSLLLYTGCRCSDVVLLELHDLLIGERSGTAVFPLRQGWQAAVGAASAPGPPCDSGVPGHSAPGADHSCLRR
jgi:integrase/recombinase XerC